MNNLNLSHQTQHNTAFQGGIKLPKKAIATATAVMLNLPSAGVAIAEKAPKADICELGGKIVNVVPASNRGFFTNVAEKIRLIQVDAELRRQETKAEACLKKNSQELQQIQKVLDDQIKKAFKSHG
ncbi:MAG: hypothetical protein WCK67_10535 [bacterium]